MKKSEPLLTRDVQHEEVGQRYLFDHRSLWSHNFPDDDDPVRHLHFVDCVIDAVRAQLLSIPQGNYAGFNRYDTDNQDHQPRGQAPKSFIGDAVP